MRALRPARLVHPAFRFGVTPEAEAFRLARAGVGGFCLYGGGAAATLELTRALRAAAPGPLLFSSDYEDGTGQRLSDGTRLPCNMAIAASGDPSLARRKGEITGAEARAAGVEWALAPVADLADEPQNPIVSTRAFGSDPVRAAAMAAEYAAGLRSSGALSCAKHFPGHGGAREDSHLELPSLSRTEERMEADIGVFAEILGAVDSVMAGHLLVPSLDPSAPASLSAPVISGLLRGRLAFRGCVVTDALEMKAVAADPSAGLRAFLAGADVLLAPEDPSALIAALEEAVSSGRIEACALAAALARQDELVRRAAAAAPPDLSVIGCAAHAAFAEEAAPRCLARAFGGWSRPAPGERVAVLELGAAGPGPAGGPFAEELARLGLKPEKYSPGFAGRLAITSFSGPRALSGKINLSAEEKAAALSAASAASAVAMAAFGSPFVFRGLSGALDLGLCAFSALPPFQRAAARVLAGAAEAAGTMPVKLGPEEGT